MSRLLILLALPCLLAADPPRDIACTASDHYVGGIDRLYSLTISGPKEKTWAYSFKLSPVANDEGSIKAAGTYELRDDLALFTGKVNQEEVRLGLNYGFPAGKVEFNGFFPTDEQTLRYHRQWFHKVGTDWKPLAELKLTLPRTAPTGEMWSAALRGEFVQYDGDAPKRTKIDETLTYRRLDGGIYQLGKAPPSRIPAILAPVLRDGRLDFVRFYVPQPTPAGILRGFHPQLATGD